MLGRLLDSASVTARALAAVARSGLMAPERPDRLARIGLEVERRGPLAAVCGAAAIRWGDRAAFADELGILSFTELDRRSNALARQLIEAGCRPGEGVAILCRNHRGFVDASFAAAKAGLRAIYMNTEFAGPQIADVCEREGAETLILDAEYEDRAPRLPRLFRAWEDGEPAGAADANLEELIAAGSDDPLPPPSEEPTVVMLTSGTTGTPKGAPRGKAGSIINLGALLERVPFRTREATWIAPPMFHALGFAHLGLALSLGSTVHTRRRFDPVEMLAGIERGRCTAAIVVPAMLQRILALGAELDRHDTSALRIIFCGGSQLPGPVATATLETFGDVLHVLYGSTEVAYASISTPADHHAAPASVGRPALGTKVRLLDEAGGEVPRGESGRIFVSNGIEFSGYTDGQTKEVIGGLMSTGDVGHLDGGGRLHIDGRDDDMIVSGGENVFPQEVEELLMAHAAIADAAVIGVDDERFGRRLAAYVVVAEGAELAEEEVRNHVAANLARYKVPRDVRFIERLPRNATGKVLKRELAG